MRYAVAALAVAILLAPLVWRLSAPLAPAPEESGGDASEIARLTARRDRLEDVFREIRERMEGLERAALAREGQIEEGALEEAPASTFGGFDELMLLSARRDYNEGLSLISISELTETFGQIAPELDDQCTEPTSERLLAALEIRDVGPFRARMVRPALDSLQRIFERVKAAYPDLYEQLRTYGGFCVRLVRGSMDSISRHAFGLAIDVSIGGTLDSMGDGKTQFGLIILRDYFYEEGWIWGAAFGREDSMHFEVSAELFAQWRDAELL